MPLISVPTVYNGTNIALLEKPPSRTPSHVLVTFVEPVDATNSVRATRLASSNRSMPGETTGPLKPRWPISMRPAARGRSRRRYDVPAGHRHLRLLAALAERLSTPG